MDKKKVLIVDDEPDIVELLSMRFEINGYSVLAAQNGEEALEKVNTGNPDIVILDLMLPKITGYEVCRMLKFDDKHRDIPIIILSALDQQQEREKAVAGGADAYFIKPFDMELLMVKVRELTQ